MKRTSSALLALALCACSSYTTHRRAQIAEQTGDWDQAVVYYLDLVETSAATPLPLSAIGAGALLTRLGKAAAATGKARLYWASSVLRGCPLGRRVAASKVRTRIDWI